MITSVHKHTSKQTQRGRWAAFDGLIRAQELGSGRGQLFGRRKIACGPPQGLLGAHCHTDHEADGPAPAAREP